MNEKPKKSINHSDFMRARRPELYSDTLAVEENSMDRSQFEFHLDTLTQRKQEIQFETFARVLAEKELCPNLLPQTGPTGGGDSKVDTETYPVADEISERWYEGTARKGASERWAFAISAKKAWKPKIQSDIEKVVKTGRSYSLIYFITNQSVRDKDRAEVEDGLQTKWGIDVRILDRTWIVEKVTVNRRWDIVEQTLGLQLPQSSSKISSGPLDAERLRELQELDAQIENTAHYKDSDYQLAEDCLSTALLARGLERSRTEIDGRFDRAARFAVKRNDGRQIRRILYMRAWTAIWWFDDHAEADRLYDKLAPKCLAADSVWEIDDLVNLWLAGSAKRLIQTQAESTHQWFARTAALRSALQRHAIDTSRITSSLWARTQLLLMDLSEAAQHRERLPDIFQGIKHVLEEVQGQIEFPVEPLIRIVRELGEMIEDDESFDELSEMVITLQSKRRGNGTEGSMRLERGDQHLKCGKTYEAIDQFAKAQMLLAQEEQREEFISALAGTALAYESAGLLWAARANLVVALDRCLYTYVKVGSFDQRALPLIRKLIWVELQLGRVPFVFCWMELLRVVSAAVGLSASNWASFQDEIEAIDRVLGILVLRTASTDWAHLDRIANVFEDYSLLMSSAATLFMLGHEDQLRTDFRIPDEDLQEFFSLWLQQPAADDLPIWAEWHIQTSSAMQTSLLGCKVTVNSRGGGTTVLLAESMLAFLESFFSTAIKLTGCYSPRPELIIEVRQSEQAQQPFSCRVSEDDCGETRVIVVHPPMTAAQIVVSEKYQEAMFEFFARILVELQLSVSKEDLETLFSKHRAQDRAFVAARSILALENVLGISPKFRAIDWNATSKGESLAQLRDTPWIPTVQALDASTKNDKPPLKFAEVPPPQKLFGVDGLKHRNLAVVSPINIPLWDKARWNGTGFLVPGGSLKVPHMILIFANVIEGCKIFKGWQKQVGTIDEGRWIGLTIITGISREFPTHYRVVFGVSERHIQKCLHADGLFAMVYRMCDMTPENDLNLNRFLSEYGQAKRFKLQPGAVNGHEFLGFSLYQNLSIGMTQLAVIPAWKIGPNNPISGAMGGIDDPHIPAGVTDAPILTTIARRRELKQTKTNSGK